jgi:hypothetical protein
MRTHPQKCFLTSQFDKRNRFRALSDPQIKLDISQRKAFDFFQKRGLHRC